MMNFAHGQMELSLPKAPGCSWESRRQRRLRRANWWFQRMRQAVDRAVEWEGQPGQPGKPADQRQVCE
jgi:hypothetical protein